MTPSPDTAAITEDALDPVLVLVSHADRDRRQDWETHVAAGLKAAQSIAVLVQPLPEETIALQDYVARLAHQPLLGPVAFESDRGMPFLPPPYGGARDQPFETGMAWLDLAPDLRRDVLFVSPPCAGFTRRSIKRTPRPARNLWLDIVLRQPLSDPCESHRMRIIPLPELERPNGRGRRTIPDRAARQDELATRAARYRARQQTRA